MTVEEYFEEWWTQKELPQKGFNKTAMLDFAEMYHKQALRIHDVVGRSEQLESGLTCMMCRKPKENDGHTCCEECTGLAF